MIFKIDTIKKTLPEQLLHGAIVFALFCATFFALTSLVSSGSFGWDESVYLTKARSWIEGTPADQFRAYRPIGMVGAGWFLLQISHAESFVRTFGVVFGALTILTIYLLFTRMFNAWVGIGVALVTGTSSLFLKEAPQFFNDVPSSALLLGLLYLIYVSYDTAGKSRLIYLAPLMVALPFYLRYGVITTLAVIFLASLLILIPKFRQKRDVEYSHLMRALYIALVLFIPHFLQSFIETGKLLGILTSGGSAAGRKFLGEGLVNYISWLPQGIGGWPLGVAAITGAVVTIGILLRSQLRQKHAGLFWIGSIGLLSFLVTGLLVHAEPRYVFFPMVLLSGTGIAGLYYVLQKYSIVLGRVCMLVISLIALWFGVTLYQENNSFFRTRDTNRTSQAYVEALQTIHEDNAGKNGCTVWLVLFAPTASWYSECNIEKVSTLTAFEQDIRSHPANVLYSIVFTSLKENQITPQTAEKFGITLTELFRVNKTTRGDLIVYRLTKNEFKTPDNAVKN